MTSRTELRLKRMVAAMEAMIPRIETSYRIMDEHQVVTGTFEPLYQEWTDLLQAMLRMIPLIEDPDVLQECRVMMQRTGDAINVIVNTPVKRNTMIGPNPEPGWYNELPIKLSRHTSNQPCPTSIPTTVTSTQS